MSNAYCNRCLRQFGSARALWQHEENSQIHANLCWICPICDEGFYDEDDLLDHQDERSHHPFFCRPCNRTFNNENNLLEHNKIHLRRHIECPYCDQFFTLLGGLFLHLESNNCIGRFEFFRIAWIMDRKGCIMLNRDDFYDFEDYYDDRYDGGEDMFYCVECDRDFKKLSGLAQHLESGGCDHRGRINILEKLVHGIRSGKRFTLKY